MIILGLNAYHPDAAVALLRDGVLVWAAEEERYNRIKHSSGFPALALQHCLKETGIRPEEIDVVAISKNSRAHLLRKMKFVLQNRPHLGFILDRMKAFGKASRFEDDLRKALGEKKKLIRAKFVNVEHHLCHIASCFFLSGFNQAAFISLDGLGDFSSAMWGRGDGTRFYVMDRVFFPHSAGFFYTAGTQFLGFLSFGDEYKVMGLAAYGKPVYLDEFRKMIKLKPKGKFELQLDYFTQHRGQSKVRWEGGKPEQDILFSPRWTEIFGNPREAHEAVKDREKNMAASMQAVLEEIYFHVLNYLYQETKADNLCVAGGVAFNSVANGKITKNTPFKNIYIQPAAGDSGTSIGAAAYVYHAVLRRPRRFVMNQALYGSEFTDTDVEKMLKDKKLSYDKLDEEELIRRTVKALTEEKIVGWFQGKMEFGPRALGNRSILADPRCARMKDILNERIKRRESFRPFAPAVPEEYAGEYFEMDCPVSPFMLKVFPVRPEKKTVIPAITHVDGTARVQTVSKSEHPIFWKLLTAFGKETGVYVLLNTSFNENEPIVCTPQEAVECFIKTKMDVLVLGNYFAVKEE